MEYSRWVSRAFFVPKPNNCGWRLIVNLREVNNHCNNLGMKVHPTKRHFLPIIVGDNLGMILDFEKGEFRAPIDKIKSVVVLAKTLLCRAASHKRWVSVKTLASLAKKAQFLHLAIPMARFFLRELHDVVKTAKS